MSRHKTPVFNRSDICILSNNYELCNNLRIIFCQTYLNLFFHISLRHFFPIFRTAKNYPQVFPLWGWSFRAAWCFKSVFCLLLFTFTGSRMKLPDVGGDIGFSVATGGRHESTPPDCTAKRRACIPCLHSFPFSVVPIPRRSAMLAAGSMTGLMSGDAQVRSVVTPGP